jgi:hypothetical protein
MTVYHVNTEGVSGVCGVTTGTCPFKFVPAFGDLHFDDKEEAERAAERYVEERAELETFPRPHSSVWIGQQAKVLYAEDFGGYRGKPLTEEQARAEFNDYLAGFEAALEAENGVADEGNIEDNYAEAQNGAYDSRVFRTGFARGLNTMNEDREFLKRDFKDFNRDPYANDKGKYDNIRFMHNPFKQGQTILIPTGTPYATWEKGKSVRKVTKRPVRQTVQISSPPYANGSVGKLFLYPGRIETTANREGYGDHKNFAITPELLSANGLPVLESAGNNTDLYLTPIYDTIRQFDKV